MYAIDRQDIEGYYESRKEEWEFEHHGQEFPLILDGKGSTDEVLAEIDIASHTRREA